jgi:hypothetical protein
MSGTIWSLTGLVLVAVEDLMKHLLGLFCLVAIGCDDTNFGGEEEVSGSGFEAVTEVFEAECVACHSAASALGGLDLETDPCGDLVGVEASNPSYGGAMLVAAGDHEASVLWDKVAENGNYGAVMPTAGRMAEGNIDIIQQWIEDGAECDSGGGGDPVDTGDTGDVTEAEYSLAQVQDQVMTPFCRGCHGGANPAASLDLSDLAAIDDITTVMSSSGIALVTPGDPEGSYLYMKMRGSHDPDGMGDRGEIMPPPDGAENPGGLEDTDDLLLVYGWILEGAAQ